MLGRFEVVGDEGQPAVFRSRKVASLMALLCLHLRRRVSTHLVKDLLWPDSDGDRQAQSLRRAVADLRDALELDASRGAIVHAEEGSLWLEESSIHLDVHRFELLLSENRNAAASLFLQAEALALYAGPIMSPVEDAWVYPYRRQYEELYCAAVVNFCRALAEQGQADQAVRIAHNAIHAAPLREEPFIASILAYAAAGNETMALRQFEALEQMLDDNFGQTPSEAAARALQTKPVAPAPVPVPDPAPIGHQTATAYASRYYIRREADQVLEDGLEAEEGTLIVFGPRQVGKTSLLAQLAQTATGTGRRVAITDFQSLSSSEVSRSAALYRSLAHSLATQLDVVVEPTWNEWVGPNSNFDKLVGEILRKTQGPVVWMMDEVDRLFGTDHSDDFFGLVRSWYNRRALDPTGLWRRLTIVISYATEAHLFIADLAQSPFNVGLRVNLRDFTLEQVIELASRFGEPNSTGEAVYCVTQGHPFLSRRALSFLKAGGGLEEMIAAADDGDGPFGEHLRRLRDVITQDAQTAQEARRLLRGEPLVSNAYHHRFWTAGLLALPPPEQPTFRVPAYEGYLRRVLG